MVVTDGTDFSLLVTQSWDLITTLRQNSAGHLLQSPAAPHFPSAGTYAPPPWCRGLPRLPRPREGSRHARSSRPDAAILSAT